MFPNQRGFHDWCLLGATRVRAQAAVFVLAMTSPAAKPNERAAIWSSQDEVG